MLTKDLDLDVYKKFKDQLNIGNEVIPKPTFFGHYWEGGKPEIINAE